jgi:formylglycine-generating enzyme required for sulfatase activity
MQRWGWPLPDPGLPVADCGWIVNSEGFVLVAVDASSDPKIGRKFEIATKEVTVEQLRRFFPGQYSNLPTAPTVDCPANVVLWFTAVAYCQWLSEKEGIPEQEWCYPPLWDLDDPPLRQLGNSKGPPLDLARIPAVDLSRTGYRLPTMDEWQFACGAGATTSRFYGETDELLANYAWYLANSRERSWPGGRLKPNDFGLFDMLGNIAEWSGDRYGDRPGDRPDNKVHVWMAGSGTYRATAAHLHTDTPDYALPRSEFNSYGFRIARTLPARSPAVDPVRRP